MCILISICVCCGILNNISFNIILLVKSKGNFFGYSTAGGQRCKIPILENIVVTPALMADMPTQKLMSGPYSRAI